MIFQFRLWVSSLKNCNDQTLQFLNANLEETFMLTTDNSSFDIVSMLQENFKGLTTNKQEYNEIVWAAKQVRTYLYGRKFKLIKVHRPLTWLIIRVANSYVAASYGENNIMELYIHRKNFTKMRTPYRT